MGVHLFRTATVRRIQRVSRTLQNLSAEALLRRSRELQWEAASGTPLSRLLVRAYAIVHEAARRVFGYQHYRVQLQGGIALFAGGIAEMQTGEGKTLTALLPAYLHALVGKGCHVVTANDYLAERDAAFARELLTSLGLTVGCVSGNIAPEMRGPEYAADITYGTAKEIGFDFLRDRLKTHGLPPGQHGRTLMSARGETREQPVQRGLHFALVDEADSILIDDAKTPLLIASGESQTASQQAFYRWCSRAAGQLTADQDYLFDRSGRSVHLTERGCHRTLALPKPASLSQFDVEQLYQQMERAITADRTMLRDRDYVVVNDQIAIVDESTGRVLEGRKWQEGLHQAIEAKERLPITETTCTAARITVQSFFNEYQHLAGLTGTARAATRELRSIYRLGVTTIPTHRPCQRTGLKPRVFKTLQDKWQAVAAAVEQLTRSGRAILIGTPSVESSAGVSRVLNERCIAHTVLNCLHHEDEAEIISQAGRSGCVTVATNMAGRGTDIKLEDPVLHTGGLHVIATEVHSSARIDRQLIGRTARQGEPGSYQFLVSLEDELWRSAPPARSLRLQHSGRANARGELPARYFREFLRLQRRLERASRKNRRQLLKRETEQNKQAKSMGFDPWLEIANDA